MTEPVEASGAAISPLRCFTGSLIAGSLAMVMYRMMVAIATTFASKPITSDNRTVIAISGAVRTLVVGLVALGAGVFGIAAVGLLLLGVQLLVQKVTGPKAES
jgi:hypothetical protein